MRLTAWYIGGVAALLTSAALVALQAPAPDQLGPQVGDHIPDFSGVDQFGRQQTLGSIAGEAGAFVVFFRSADW
jgi:hypothetical protein